MNDSDQGQTPDTPPEINPLHGVKGWLKFFVVMNLYVGPTLFVLTYILAWIGFSILSDDYPSIIFIGLVETVVAGFFALKWIQLSKRLRDIEPGIIQETKKWLKLSLAWIFFDAPLVYMTGMDPEDLALDTFKAIATGLISFTIWYRYFSVSKRVRATYPDWDDSVQH